MGFVTRRSKSGLTTVEVTVISGIVLALGIFLIYVANNWYLASMIEAAEEIEENIHIIRSALLVENISLSYTTNNITVRNVAKDDLSLKIIAVELLSMDGRLHGRLSDLNYVVKRGEKLVIENVPGCNNCNRGEVLRYRVWYVPEKYAGYKFSTPREAIFIESSFIYDMGEPSLPCPLPEDRNYVMIDIVDPVLLTSGEFSGSNAIRIRPAVKPVPSTVNIEVDVESLSEGSRGSGVLKNVRVPTFELVTVTGDFSGIKVPLRISINSTDPDTDKNISTIQREWIMGGTPNGVFVSGISLLWRETDYMVHTVVVDIAAQPLPRDVSVKISLTLRDCKGILERVEVRERISAEMDADLPVFIRLPKAVRFDQIHFIETRIEEVN